MKEITLNVYESDWQGWESNYMKKFDNFEDLLEFVHKECTEPSEVETQIKAEKFALALEDVEVNLDCLNEAFQEYAEVEDDKEFVRDLCLRVNDIIDAYDELQDFLEEEDR